MRLRSLLLPVVLAGGLSSIFFLPQTGKVAQSAIDMTLPKTIGNWYLNIIPASQAEIDILSKDTRFAKANCLRARPGEFAADGRPIPDRVDLSVVLSGYDLNNSIHRPERCMPAQGHRNLRATTLPLRLPNGRTLTVRRLRSTQTIITNPDDRSQDHHFECVSYYFFIGHDRVEYDHLQRTLADMQDRLIRGMDQRWAYVTATMWFGKVPWIEQPITEAEADAKVVELLTEFVSTQVNWEQIR
jgi:hypothetical protein